MGRHCLDRSIVNAMKDLRNSGVRVQDIAAQFHYVPWTVYYHTKDMDKPRKPRVTWTTKETVLLFKLRETNRLEFKYISILIGKSKQACEKRYYYIKSLKGDNNELDRGDKEA
jgi:hypothetical protein